MLHTFVSFDQGTDLPGLVDLLRVTAQHRMANTG